MTGQKKPRLAWEAPFLAALGEGRTVSSAAQIARIDRSTPYHRRTYNAEFARQWDEVIAGTVTGAGRKGRAQPAEPPRGPHWRKLFLETLAETSNVTAAAARANVPAGTAYKARRAEPAFRAQWYAALLEGYEHLEMETLHRLRMGTGKDSAKFDTANALRLLALHKETVARERALREEEDEDAILASIDARIEEMRTREREAARIVRDAAGRNLHELG